jgi:CRP/FNR family transcriptional regulator, cyclic AMP receptor protein
MNRIEAEIAAYAALEARDPARMGPNWVPVLEHVPLFAGLPLRQLSRVAAVARLKRFAAGTAVVRMGDPGNAFFVILDGSALVVRPTGRPLKLGPGDFFGEMALLDDAPRSADVIAAEEMLAMTIGRSAFTKLLRGEPKLTHAILRTVAGRLRAAQRSPV